MIEEVGLNPNNAGEKGLRLLVVSHVCIPQLNVKFILSGQIVNDEN